MKNKLFEQDIRWKQRFNNFISAFQELEAGVKLAEQRDLSKTEQLGMLSVFTSTYELAWKVCKDYLEEQGVASLVGPVDSIRAAFKAGLIEDGDTWMEMIKARNITAHEYDEEKINQILQQINPQFYPTFLQMKKRFNKLYEQNNE